MGVEGHFLQGPPSVPWWTIEDETRSMMAEIVGAREDEVVCMNSLTVNLHLLLAAFYRPTPERFKILIEPNAFPSDEYAVQSCAKHHGYDPDVAIVRGDAGAIGDDVAVVLISAVQYYTGEFFDVRAVAARARARGAVAGFDLAHAVGNVELHLHDDDVDFAVWCSYKYLNAGPGGLAGAFVHSRHDVEAMDGALRGWWGNARSSRFEMRPTFDPQPGVAGLQLSNPPTIPMLALRDALQIHVKVGMPKIRAKSRELTARLETLLRQALGDNFAMLTPEDPNKRGAQLSLLFEPPDFDVDAIHDHLRKHHIFVDVRRPNVIRVAPAPLYNTLDDIQTFVSRLEE
ncbi:hypothetical protein CTAYLR_000349 [Chrysophaeum taylorii]|uniref:Kynureninase n=1 Tax=Chrysophaeum taylorii TaxID=2483200 RepID=A0AAD7XMZ3_9STRA|nr:hypothetical protein CTAYLR_000349 [Chrysophaeum taylorii]